MSALSHSPHTISSISSRASAAITLFSPCLTWPIYTHPQTKRRRHLPPLEFHARDALPPGVPAGDRWMQCISNRTLKSRVIQLVIHRLTSTLSTLLPGDSQCLIVDYQDAPVRYTKIAPPTPLTGPTMSTPLGEADVKFVRYAGMFEKLQVDSVDGDSIPIALLHMERGGLGQVSVLRLETKLKEQKDAAAQASKKIKLTPGAAAATKRPARVYEYVDIRLLFDALRCMIIPQCTGRAPLASHDGHEMSMLVCLIGLSGSDFTRGLPLVSGKTIHDYLPSIWTRLARAYDTSTRQLNPDAALDVLVSAIYRRKFDKHCCVGGGLDEVLSSIKTSSLSIKTRERLPSRETLHCTVRNVNWLLCYWHQPDYPDPVQPQFGFVRDRKGVRFDA